MRVRSLRSAVTGAIAVMLAYAHVNGLGAQAKASGKKAIVDSLDLKDGKVVLTSPASKDSTPIAIAAADTATFSVVCAAQLDCTKLLFWMPIPGAAKAQIPAQTTTTTASFVVVGNNVPASGGQKLTGHGVFARRQTDKDSVRIGYLAQSQVTVGGGGGGDGGSTTAVPVSIAPLLATDCSAKMPKDRPLNPVVANVGRILVSPTGAILSRPPSNFNEGNELEVDVLVAATLCSRDECRPNVGISNDWPARNTIGSDAQIISTIMPGLQDKTATSCTIQALYVYDFAPGVNTGMNCSLSPARIAHFGLGGEPGGTGLGLLPAGPAIT